MKFLLFTFTVFYSVSTPFASCGLPEDPNNELLQNPHSQILSDSLQEVWKKSGYVSIAHVDSFHCINAGAKYPVYNCKVKIIVDTILKGESTGQTSYDFSLVEYVGSLFMDISDRFFLLYSSESGPEKITIAGGCYSPHWGYYIQNGKLFNKLISKTNYLPADSLGWNRNETISKTYLLGVSNIQCITAPCRSLQVTSSPHINTPVSAILDSAGKVLAGSYEGWEKSTFARGRIDTARLEGWRFADTVFIVEQIIGTYENTPTSISIKHPTRTSGCDNSGKFQYDVLGRVFPEKSGKTAFPIFFDAMEASGIYIGP